MAASNNNGGGRQGENVEQPAEVTDMMTAFQSLTIEPPSDVAGLLERLQSLEGNMEMTVDEFIKVSARVGITVEMDETASSPRGGATRVRIAHLIELVEEIQLVRQTERMHVDDSGVEGERTSTGEREYTMEVEYIP